ncbi:MAG: hypothetical protein IE913_00630 [Halothiobacillus sp.]|nr:hypothetical protein [Halothiobacillus sp.]
MANIDDAKLKAFLKDVSSMISELAHSLDSYVEDEPDEAAKRAFKEQIAEAEKMAGDLDDAILRIILGR